MKGQAACHTRRWKDKSESALLPTTKKDGRRRERVFAPHGPPVRCKTFFDTTRTAKAEGIG